MRFTNTPESRIAVAAALAGAKQTILEAEQAIASGFEGVEHGHGKAFALLWEMAFVHLRNLEDWRIPE